jgi:o-succinylbenzoate synthase
MKAWIKPYELKFMRPVQTSRASYETRRVWFLFLEVKSRIGIGECAPLPGLSHETTEEVEELLRAVTLHPKHFLKNPEVTQPVSSVHLALESAWLDLQRGGNRVLFPSPFTDGRQGIPINGLIWMGSIPFMQQQIEEKLKAGFRCIKLKIGGQDFEKELAILQAIREQHSPDQLTLRLDANGAFAPNEALQKLQRLAPLHIHSVEQPIAPGQWNEMALLCKKSPVPIAFDEELIGITSSFRKEELLRKIRPQFLVLKPSLHGGFSGCNEWILMANHYHIDWWITSYLESNIGLNAIAQWAFHQQAKGYQGLGTGALYSNNIPSPLAISHESLWSLPERKFQIPDHFLSR